MSDTHRPEADTIKNGRIRTSSAGESDLGSAHYITINRIFVLGNKRTREPIILRELSVKPGDSIKSRSICTD